MNEERAMILKMLREGKISVEEADALLDVLNEGKEDEPAGFAASSVDQTTGEDSGARTETHSDSGRPKNEQGAKFDLDLDLSGITDGLRSAMSSVKESMAGVGDTLREAFSELSSADIHKGEGFFGTFRTEMGRARAEDDRKLAGTVGDATELKISNPWGDIRIVGVQTGEISGIANLTCWAADEAGARALLDDTSVELEVHEGVIALEIDGGAKRKLRVDIELEVPTQLAVTVALASGDLWLEGVTGPVVGHSISGDIHVANIGNGPDVVQLLTTKSGDISAHSVSGLLTLSSASGDIAISSYHGALSATSQSGEIEVTDAQGSIEAKSISGDLSVEIQEIADGAVKLTSVSGDVAIALPAHIGYTVALSTLSGDIENDLELADKEQTTRSLRGRHGTGDIPVSVTTVSGDIGLSEK